MAPIYSAGPRGWGEPAQAHGPELAYWEAIVGHVGAVRPAPDRRLVSVLFGLAWTQNVDEDDYVGSIRSMVGMRSKPRSNEVTDLTPAFSAEATTQASAKSMRSVS